MFAKTHRHPPETHNRFRRSPQLFIALAVLCAAIFGLAASTVHAQTKSTRLTIQAAIDKHAVLTEAFFPWAHNAYNSSAYGYTVQVNQDITITAQLDAGQRLIDLDPQYCHGYDDPIRLSHNICGEDDSPLRDRLSEIRTWFLADTERLENEVVILFVEAGDLEMWDSLGQSSFDQVIGQLSSTGLASMIYRPSSSCTGFEGFAETHTKADVLNAGKNILIFGADSVTCTRHDWGSWAFNVITSDRVEHGVYYPMVMNRFDGYPKCSYETELFWNKTTHYMHKDTRFNYAYNDKWALSPLDTMSASEIEKMAGCGVNAISHEYFDPESSTHEALIWSWADGEPNAAASSNQSCAKTGGSGLVDRSCTAGHYFACQHLDTGAWKVSSAYGPWASGAQVCYEEFGLDYGFSVPPNGWQMNELKEARPSSSTQVWVNFTDLDDHGDWEPFRQLTRAEFDFANTVDGTVHGTTTIDLGFSGGSVPYTAGRDGSSNSAIDFNALSNPVLKGAWEQNFDDRVSISVWFKADPGANPTNNQRLVEFSSNGTWATSTAIVMETDGSLTAWCDDETDGVRRGLLGTGSATYMDGQWHRAVLTHDSNYARLYVDGAEVGSTTDTCQNIADAQYLSIGSYYVSGTNRKFHGTIDAVDIYGATLDQTDIGEGSKIVGDWGGGTVCLDAAGGHNAGSGANVQLWDCAVTGSSWIYNPGTGKIHAAWNQNLCLDVAGSNSSTTNANVGIYHCSGVETWIWDSSDRKFRTAYNTGMCLDAAGWQATANGTNVQIHPCGNVNETWSEPSVGDLPNLAPMKVVGDWAGGAKCLEAAGGSSAGHQANVQVQNCSSATSTWVYNSSTRKVHAGWNLGLCLDVDGTNNSQTDRNVQLWDCDAVTETWEYDPTDRKIRTGYNSSMCLDVAGHHTTSNRNVQIHPCSNVGETWNGAGT